MSTKKTGDGFFSIENSVDFFYYKSMAHKIGVVMSRVNSQYLQDIWEGLEAASYERRVQLFYFIVNSADHTDSAEMFYDSIYRMVSRFGVDGVIILAGALTEAREKPEFISMLEDLQGLPVLLTGVRTTDGPVLYIDNIQPSFALVEHLILVHDHKNIGFIGGPVTSDEANERYEGFQKAVQKYGLRIDDSWITNGNFTRESGYKAMKSLWEKSQIHPDALVVANQNMVLGVIDYCIQKKILIPNDLAIVSYDDFTEALFINPALTVIQVPLRKFGMQAVSTMIDQIENREHAVESLQAKLVVRASCGCMPTPRAVVVSDHGQKTDFEHAIDPQFKSADRAESNIKFHVLKSFQVFTHMVKGEVEFEYNLICNEIQELISIGLSPERTVLILDIWMNWVECENVMSDRVYYAVSSILHSQISRKDYLLHMEDMRKRTAIQNTGIRLLSSLELDELKKILYRNLPGLGIADSFIYLFDSLVPYTGQGNPPYDGHLFFHQVNQNSVFGISRKDVANFNLIEKLDLLDKGNYIMLPLYMDGEVFGIAGFLCQNYFFELYDNVRAYLSAAIKGGTLLAEQKKSKEALSVSHKNIMEKSLELEIANKSKDMFLANMSHEIRTPLNAILGFADLLMSEETDRDKKTYIDAIISGGKTLLGIVNTVLELSRIEAGRIEIKQQEIALKELLDRIVTRHNSRSRSKNFQIQMEVGQLTGYSVFVDETKIIQIVNNILAVALNMNNDDKVVLEYKTRVSGQGRCELDISVINHNEACTKEQVAKIFEPFAKYSETMVVEELDTGLALALSRKIARAMKGELICELYRWPDNKKGLRFNFSLKDVLYFDSSGLPLPIHDDQVKEIPINDLSMEDPGLSDFEIKVLQDILGKFPNVQKEYFVINEIALMAAEIMKTGRKLALKGVMDFAVNLEQSCEEFNLDRINELIHLLKYSN